MDSRVPTNARLVLENADGRRVVQIRTLPFTIGRAADRSLSLGYAHISREHATIERDAEGYLLRDTASRHGTFLNGTRITSARLRSSDLLRFGLSHDVVVFEEIEESTTRTLLNTLSRAEKDPTGKNDLERLSLFLKAVQSLSSLDAINDVLRTMLEFTIRLTGAERGFVFLGERADALLLEYGQDRRGTPITEAPAISYSVVRDAAASNRNFVISDVTDDLARGRESLVVNSIRSVVAIPLRSEGSSRLLGLLYLDSHSQSYNFNSTDKDILHAIARQAATLMENVRLLQIERESALMKKELEIAASIQRQIIPRTLPDFPFARVAARTVPCAGVGGDFYDVIALPDGFVAIVADVCGKGVPAALLASMVQGMFHGQFDTPWNCDTTMTEVVQALNAFVCSRAPEEKYVTMVVLRYIQQQHGAQIELVNGGHISPLIVRADGTVESIDDGDVPVGMLPFARFHSIRATLGVGDRIILLSDGLTEAEDAEGVQFGAAQLERHLFAPDPVSELFHAMEVFCGGVHPQDDHTALAIERVN